MNYNWNLLVTFLFGTITAVGHCARIGKENVNTIDVISRLNDIFGLNMNITQIRNSKNEVSGSLPPDKMQNLIKAVQEKQPMPNHPNVPQYSNQNGFNPNAQFNGQNMANQQPQQAFPYNAFGNVPNMQGGSPMFNIIPNIQQSFMQNPSGQQPLNNFQNNMNVGPMQNGFGFNPGAVQNPQNSLYHMYQQSRGNAAGLVPNNIMDSKQPQNSLFEMFNNDHAGNVPKGFKRVNNADPNPRNAEDMLFNRKNEGYTGFSNIDGQYQGYRENHAEISKDEFRRNVHSSSNFNGQHPGFPEKQSARDDRFKYNQNGEENNLFQRVADKNYNGMSNVDPLMSNVYFAPNKERTGNYQQQPQEQRNQYKESSNVESSIRNQNQNNFGANQAYQNPENLIQNKDKEDNMNQPNENKYKDVDAFLGRVMGEHIFEKGIDKLLLNQHDPNIKPGQYPATEESLFKNRFDQNDERYDYIFNNQSRRMPSDLDKYKSYNVPKIPDEHLDDVRNRVLEQNKVVNGDENTLNKFFDIIKEKEVERKRDEEYGRVRRDVETTTGQISVTHRKTRRHILKDVDEAVNFVRNYGENSFERGSSPFSKDHLDDNDETKNKVKREILSLNTNNERFHDMAEPFEDEFKIVGDNNGRLYDFVKPAEERVNIVNKIVKNNEQMKQLTENFYKQLQINERSQVNNHNTPFKHSKLERILSRHKRQQENLQQINNEILDIADRFSRLPYNELFPAILQQFDIYREESFGKAMRKSFRHNGWSMDNPHGPPNPREKVPQVFRHFKYVLKTRLEEFYFIMTMRLQKLVKLHIRTLNIFNRCFTEANLKQLRGYWQREYEIEQDFNSFSKVLRNKIFNAYMDMEDRFNEQGRSIFALETLPPFNKDPTAPPEMEKFKGNA